LWALVFSRFGSALIAAVVVMVRGFDRTSVPIALVVVAGLFDVGGNVFYVLARESMPLGLAAALVGVYPVVTLILARVVIGEHLPRLGQLGVGLAILGIILISLGG
jgi:drug/metabolite transporter (DMT)-like permease